MLQVLFFLAVILHRSSALSWPSSLNSPAIHFVGHINHFPKLGKGFSLSGAYPHVNNLRWTDARGSWYIVLKPWWERWCTAGVLTSWYKEDSLLDYTRKPDCFRRAASALRMRCAEADMREDERINGNVLMSLLWAYLTLNIAAIVMTLCELSTASHHSIPLECTPFSLDKIDQVSLEFLSQGDCVESVILKCVILLLIRALYRAFSRSTQFWSSYSGYLREVRACIFERI